MCEAVGLRLVDFLRFDVGDVVDELIVGVAVGLNVGVDVESVGDPVRSEVGE